MLIIVNTFEFDWGINRIKLFIVSFKFYTLLPMSSELIFPFTENNILEHKLQINIFKLIFFICYNTFMFTSYF